MEPKIVARTPLEVVGMRIHVLPMSPEIPALWPRFVGRMPEIQEILEPHLSYGVMDQVPADGQKFNYMAAVSVASATALPEGMTSLVIPAGEYAVFEFPFSEIGPAFAHILGKWLPNSAYTQAETPFFERYGEAFDPTNPQSRMEVHIPVRPRVR